MPSSRAAKDFIPGAGDQTEQMIASIETTRHCGKRWWKDHLTQMCKHTTECKPEFIRSKADLTGDRWDEKIALNMNKTPQNLNPKTETNNNKKTNKQTKQTNNNKKAKPNQNKPPPPPPPPPHHNNNNKNQNKTHSVCEDFRNAWLKYACQSEEKSWRNAVKVKNRDLKVKVNCEWKLHSWLQIYPEQNTVRISQDRNGGPLQEATDRPAQIIPDQKALSSLPGKMMGVTLQTADQSLLRFLTATGVDHQ